jgi:hypothetical protein
MEKEELAMTTMEYVPSVIHELMNLVIVLVVVSWELISYCFSPAMLTFLYVLSDIELNVILPQKEADPYIPDFKYLSEKRQLIRT